MTVLPINVSDCTKAVVSMLTADTRLDGVVIERAAELNREPQLHGWVGVYRQRVEFQTRTLGMGTGYRRTRIHLIVAIQAAHARSGEACEDALEELVQKVASVILTDASLGGTVDALEDIELQYVDYFRSKSSGEFMQTAFLFVVGAVNVSVL